MCPKAGIACPADRYFISNTENGCTLTNIAHVLLLGVRSNLQLRPPPGLCDVRMDFGTRPILETMWQKGSELQLIVF